VPAHRVPAEQRFWSKVQKTPTCWFWLGARHGSGYGSFWIDPGYVAVHRYAYEQAHGTLPPRMWLMHTCGIRHCVNPDHLRALRDRIRPAVERFWPNVEKTATCWLWRAHLNGGYGYFRAGGQPIRAHVFAYRLLVGSIPKGRDLHHLCEVPACVNPAHLEPLTRREHSLRSRPARRQHCPRGHPYDEQNTYWSLGHSGYRRRVCRACVLARNHVWYVKYKAEGRWRAWARARRARLKKAMP
jgi:HNH endonuclease